MGDFLVIRLQLILSATVKNAGPNAFSSKPWWNRQRIDIPAHVYDGDLSMLARSLEPQSTNDKSSAWSRPMALLVDRSWTCQILSDASYSGLGGWSPTFHFMWRLTRADLIATGFAMRETDNDGNEDAMRETDTDTLHINVLEFVAIIINLWMVIAFIKREPDKKGGHIVSVLADNTSALSWFRYAARSHKPAVRNLAFLCHCLIVFSQTSDYANFVGKHIPGSTNDEADALSRPELFPSLGCAIKQFSRLQTCRAFRLPFGLLSTIARAILSAEIGESFVNETTNLLTLEPVTSPVGADGMPSKSGFYRRSHRGKRSR
jgi:hypothetical protein